LLLYRKILKMFGNVSLSTMRTVSPGQTAVQRSVTPSKLPTSLIAGPNGGYRTTTPTTTGRASSNPRSDSATKRMMKTVGIENEINTVAIARSASRRKQRRWENMNMFGMELHHILTAEELLHPETISPEYLFQIETKSAFQELFLPKNHHILEAFRTCDHQIPSSIVKNHTPKHLSIGDIAWLKIENRLRPILLQCLKKDPKLSLFLFCIEQVIFAYLTEQSLDAINLLIETKAMHYFQEICTIDSERNQLRIPLVDSTYYRLLLHGVCQFYAVHSKSEMLTDRNAKVTMISMSKKSSSALINKVSFVSHLLTKVRKEDHELSMLTNEIAALQLIDRRASNTEVNNNEIDVHQPRNSEDEYVLVPKEVDVSA